MAKNLNGSPIKPAKKVECQDPEHKGDRSIIQGDLWMEWPDFVLRCDACHKKGNKPNNIMKRHDKDLSQESQESQEQLELLNGDED